MRKRERNIIEGAIAGAVVFGIVDGLSQYLQLNEKGKPIIENLNFKSLTRSTFKGLFIGGTAGFLLYKIQQWEDKELLFCPDNLLHSILNKNCTRNDPLFNDTAKAIVSDLKDKIYNKFCNDLVERPLDYGSRKTKTAIGGNSDFDILIPFRKGIDSITQKGEELLEFVKEECKGNKFKVRQQRHSIGLVCKIGSKYLHIDIVAAKERNSFRNTGEITIVRKKMNFWETNAFIKSNIWVKRNLLVNQPGTRKLIKLTKLYRNIAGFKLKSVVIETLVKECVQKNNGYMNSSTYNNFTLVMAYLADQLLKRTKISDLANSNNNLIEGLSSAKRKRIALLLLIDLEKLSKSPNFLKEVFEIKN